MMFLKKVNLNRLNINPVKKIEFLFLLSKSIFFVIIVLLFSNTIVLNLIKSEDEMYYHYLFGQAFIGIQTDVILLEEIKKKENIHFQTCNDILKAHIYRRISMLMIIKKEGYLNEFLDSLGSETALLDFLKYTSIAIDESNYPVDKNIFLTCMLLDSMKKKDVFLKSQDSSHYMSM